MTAAQSFGSDALSTFTLKQEKDDCSNDNEDEKEEDSNEEDADGAEDDDESNEGDNDDDSNAEEEEETLTYDDGEDVMDVSSLAQPSILDKESFEYTKSNDEFLRLTSMVRRVYFSYLHKSIIGNYNICWQEKNEKPVTKLELKKFASRMELCAVKASLEASLYRRSMLKMISDIKSNTSSKKTYEKLQMFLETPPNVVDVAIQTNENCIMKPEKKCESKTLRSDENIRIRSSFVTSNSKEYEKKTSELSKNLDDRITELLKNEDHSKSVQLETARLNENLTIKIKKENKDFAPLIHCDEISSISAKLPGKVQKKRRQRRSIVVTPLENQRSSEDQLREILEKDDDGGGGGGGGGSSGGGETILRGTKSSIVDNDMIAATVVTVGQETEEGSQDSLMRNLEDMFCESDDSSDLMTLIEKHSGVTKANIDSEIEKMCLGDEESHELKDQEKKQQPPSSLIAHQREALKNSMEEKNVSSGTSGKRKLSFSNYKKMKKRAIGDIETPPPPPHEETAEERQNRKIRGIWFVERVHQVAKLDAKMMELSMKDYRKHGRICAKFIELFGAPDEEETMPESPIRIEEHLTACKERIAPWVVKYLMPYYTKRIIDNRLLFKTVAKHIADMLIIEKTFPEEDCVDAYIRDYFRNKTSIKIESDIYV
ncbi:eisosome protein SEG2 [Venturia canescens]|uniref:eisosome protein SEG2 n=1 Tax=Venturia canescens TaxID=32260 RepID=UPI001C9BF956|nr:eisosome protein SEG2 [Venturia canescens]